MPVFEGVLLLSRAPESAYAVWNIKRDAAPPRTLRLVDIGSGVTVASHCITEWHGTKELTLPAPGRSYVAEVRSGLADADQAVVLARSNEIVAPSNMPQAARQPTFATAADLQRAVASGQPVQPTARVSVSGTALASGVARTVGGRRPAVWMLWPGAGGSEARLFGFGSEMRLAVGASGGGLRTKALPLRFLTASTVRTPRVLMAAANALARALWHGGTAEQAHAAARALIAAMAAVGTPDGIAIVVGPSMPTAAAPFAVRSLRAAGGETADGGTADGGTAGGRADGWASTMIALVTSPSGAAGVGAALTGLMAAVTGALSRSIGELAKSIGEDEIGTMLLGEEGTILGFTSDLAWIMSGGFTLLAVLVPSPTAPEPSLPQATQNEDGSMTFVSLDGTTVTIGPPTFDDGTVTSTNADGSITVISPDGTTVTLGPPTFDDGTVTTANPDGSVTVTSPDGTTVTLGPPEMGGQPGDGGGGGGGSGGGYEGGGYEGGGYEGGGYEGGGYEGGAGGYEGGAGGYEGGAGGYEGGAGGYEGGGYEGGGGGYEGGGGGYEGGGGGSRAAEAATRAAEAATRAAEATVNDQVTGHVVLALHAHLPFVRHVNDPNALEEDWLFDALTDCYLPLLAVLEGWAADGIAATMTVSLSPTLLAMLSDDLLRDRYSHRLTRLLKFLDGERGRFRADETMSPLVDFYAERLSSTYDRFQRRYSRDVVGGFVAMEEAGVTRLITTSATHTYLPGMTRRISGRNSGLASGLSLSTSGIGPKACGCPSAASPQDLTRCWRQRACATSSWSHMPLSTLTPCLCSARTPRRLPERGSRVPQEPGIHRPGLERRRWLPWGWPVSGVLSGRRA